MVSDGTCVTILSSSAVETPLSMALFPPGLCQTPHGDEQFQMNREG